MRRAVALALVAGFAWLVAGCVYYPNTADVDGTLIRPQNGRAMRQADQALFFVDLWNGGRSPDMLLAVKTAVAGRAEIMAAAGSPVAQFEVPGASTVALHPGGPHVLLSELTRPLQAGDVIIVTLVFEKTGTIGVVTTVE